MSAAAAAADAVPAGKKPGGKKKLVMMIAIAALVLGGGGVGGLLYMKKQKAAAEAAAAEEDGGDAPVAKARKHDEKKEKPVFVPMDPFVVNLADHEADRYAQIGITLEVPDEHAGEDIKNYLPAIRNNILLLLAHKSSADLAGADGKEKLAREIRRASLRAMGEEVEDEDDDTAAAAEGDEASAPKAKKKKKKKAAEEPALPIRSVQFSSFIIQ